MTRMAHAAAPSGEDRTIQAFVTPAGIQVWLLESHTLPMVSVEASFRAGSVFEPADKGGLANLTASLFDEGAGDLDAKAFKDALENIGARFGGSADTQDMSLSLTTLTEHAPEAFRLLGLAATQPRFDEEALERMRSTILAGLKRGDEDPSTVAWRLFRPAIYGDHPYARDDEGTPESVAALTRADVQQWHRDGLTKSNMGVVAVGDVTREALSAWVDAAFGALPQGKGRMEVAAGPSETTPSITRTRMPVPQGTVLMGHLGLTRKDPDYPAMLVMNEILGGGVLTSRLGADVREKHGLVYDVRTVNSPLPFNGMFFASLATDNAKVDKALELVRKHLKLIRDEPVTDEEFSDAKAYLMGSFPLRLDSNTKLLNMLGMMQSEDMGLDYLDRWPERIAAVTKADVQRVARRLIRPEAMALVVVGDGKALEAR